MSKILLNPDNGAPISDVNPGDGTIYFVDNPWEVGTPYKFEDDKTAQFFQHTFEFLIELNVEEAKKFLQTEKLKCEQCDFETRSKAELSRHIQGHAKEQELDELGIPVVRQTRSQKDREDIVKSNIQQDIDDTARDSGLTEGEGLTREFVQKGAVMS